MIAKDGPFAGVGSRWIEQSTTRKRQQGRAGVDIEKARPLAATFNRRRSISGKPRAEHQCSQLLQYTSTGIDAFQIAYQVFFNLKQSGR
jgi:hypothetical protein